MIHFNSSAPIRETRVNVSLHCDDDVYSMRCVQIDRYARVTDAVFMRDFTSARHEALRIFNLIVKYKAFSCSICEIIEDLIC